MNVPIAVEGDFVHAISRFMNKSTRPGMYKIGSDSFLMYSFALTTHSR